MALVFLKHPFNLDGAPHIGLACLNKALPEPGTECFTMGWGKLPKEERFGTTLKKVGISGVLRDNFFSVSIVIFFSGKCQKMFFFFISSECLDLFAQINF